MLVTEEEAKTKRCQESFGPPPQQATVCNAPQQMGGNMFYVGGGGATGVYPYTASPPNCIGSACMAWRWHGWTEYVETDDAEGLPTFAAKVHTPETHGFCGKAGRPAPIK